MAELDDRKTALSAELRHVRTRLSANGRELADDLNFPAKLKASVKNHRGLWLGAAVLFGLLVTQLPRRARKAPGPAQGGKKDLERAGMAAALVGVLKVVFDVTKPLIVAWATKRVKAAVAGREERR
jgi:hypothetical protein